MKRISAAAFAALFVLESAAVSAQSAPAPSPTVNCQTLATRDIAACYAAQNAAANKASNHAGMKQTRKDALAAAQASNDSPQAIAASLLHDSYAAASLKRYRIALLTPEGHPVLENGNQVYTTPAATGPDDERAALYLQLLRLIGKTAQPPSAVKLAKAQIKAAQRLSQAMLAYGAGQPVPRKASGNVTAATDVSAATAATASGTQSTNNTSLVFGTQAPMFITPQSGTGGVAAVQSVDGAYMMTMVPSSAFVGTSYDSASIDQNDKGGCTTVPQASKSDMVRDAILRCFAHAVHNLRVQAAEDAVLEYQKWHADPYGYRPPAGFTYDAPARPPTSAGGHTLSIAGLYSGEAASAPDVRMFGLADALNAFVGADSGRAVAGSTIAKLASSSLSDMAALNTALGNSSSAADAAGTAARYVGGVGAGYLAGAGAIGSETVFNAVFPYAGRGFFTAAGWVPGIEAAEASNPVGWLVGTLTVLVQAGVDEGEKVFGNSNLPGDLNNELAADKAQADPSASDLAGSQQGRTELFTVFIGGSKNIQW